MRSDDEVRCACHGINVSAINKMASIINSCLSFGRVKEPIKEQPSSLD